MLEGHHLDGGVDVFHGVQPQHGGTHQKTADNAHEVGIQGQQGDHGHEGQHTRQHKKIVGRNTEG